MKISKVGFTSLKQDWTTPKEFYDKLNKEFKFNFDPCPTKNYTNGGKVDGLKCQWKERNFVNPPYTSGQQNLWIEKGFEEWKKGKLVVFLVPARTDTNRFHKYLLPHAEIRFIKGRLKFSGHSHPAPFPSMVCILRPKSGKKFALEQSNVGEKDGK